MTCNDCIHGEICKYWFFKVNDIPEENVHFTGNSEKCKDFKEKSHYLEKPCEPGDTFYFIVDKLRKGRHEKYRICKGVVYEVSLNLKGCHENLVIVVEMKIPPTCLGEMDIKFCSFSTEEFLRFSFKTYDEAEKALKERPVNEMQILR